MEASFMLKQLTPRAPKRKSFCKVYFLIYTSINFNFRKEMRDQGQKDKLEVIQQYWYMKRMQTKNNFALFFLKNKHQAYEP